MKKKLLGALALALLWLVSPAEEHTASYRAFFLVPIVAETLIISTAAATVIVAVGSIALSVGVSYAASKLLAKTPDAPQDAGGVQLDVRADANVPESLIVGRAVTAGSLVHEETYGKRGSIDNSDMVQIIAIADHPVTGLVTQFVDAQEVALVPSNPDLEIAERSYGVFAENRGDVVVGYNGKLALQFCDGTQTAADPLAVAALGTHPERPWTAAMVGRGRSYARVHSIFDQQLVQGPLGWRFVVDGIRLYDPRKDSTVGGSGAHRFDDLDTHEFTSNLPLIAYNILRGIRVKDHTGTPRHFYGLEGTPAASLPLDNWFAAMNEADVTIDGEPQFHGGAEFAVNVPPMDAIKQILTSCDGRLSELGGVYKLHIGPPGLPVLSFSDDDLRADQGDELKPIITIDQRVNYVTATYTAPEDGWVPKVAPPRGDATMEAQDGRRLAADLNLPMAQSAAYAQRLQQQMLRRSRQERRHSLPLPPAAFGLEPGDIVEWTSARNGYDAKLFEVDAAELLLNLNSTAAVIEVDHNDYNWVRETDYVAQPVGSLVVNRPSPKIIEGFDAQPYTFVGDNGAARPAIKVTWTAPDDGDLAKVEVQVRRSADVADPATFSTDEPASGAMIILASLTPDTAYQARGRFVSFNGYETEWSLWQDVTTPDVRLVQSDLSKSIVEFVDRELARRFGDINEMAEFIALHVVQQKVVDFDQRVAGKIDTHAVRKDLGARVDTFQETYANDQEALALWRLNIEAAITNANAQISIVAGAVTDQQGALADLGLDLTTHYATLQNLSDASASLIVQANSAIDSAISTLSLSLDSRFATPQSLTDAGVDILAQADANAANAISQFDLSVHSELGGLRAVAGLTFGTVTTIDGRLASTAMMTLDGNGYLSGLRQYNDGHEADAIFNLDHLLVASAGHDPKPVFDLGTVGGTGTIVLHGNFYGDGQIAGQSLVVETIETRHIKEAAITAVPGVDHSDSNFGVNDTSLVTFSTATVEFHGVVGNLVDVEIQALVTCQGIGEVQSVGTIILFLPDGTAEAKTVNVASAAAFQDLTWQRTLSVVATGALQSVTVFLQAQKTPSFSGYLIGHRDLRAKAFLR